MSTHKLGILGGTFNPVHIGHLLLAEHTLESLSLDEIIFIPSGTPPHKSSDILPAHHRYEMVCLATANNPRFKVSNIEALSDKPSYTAATLEILTEIYPNSEFIFTIGSDAVKYMESWKTPEKVFKLATIAVTGRAMEEDATNSIEMFRQKYNANIITLAPRLIDISATEIRKRIKSGKSINYMTPERVKQYIEKNNLYR